jgi:hypothetical protein
LYSYYFLYNLYILLYIWCVYYIVYSMCKFSPITKYLTYFFMYRTYVVPEYQCRVQSYQTRWFSFSPTWVKIIRRCSHEPRYPSWYRGRWQGALGWILWHKGYSSVYDWFLKSIFFEYIKVRKDFRKLFNWGNGFSILKKLKMSLTRVNQRRVPVISTCRRSALL